jgi:thioredoxin reductase (NADPH)
MGMIASSDNTWEVLVVGGGLAGLSAAVYLGRALRRTLVVDSGKSLARWEPEVQNYLGFPAGIDGRELLELGRRHALQYRAVLMNDEITEAIHADGLFCLKGKTDSYQAHRVLLATGLFHLPPEIPGVNECIGHSMFFCKDCDGYRVQGRRVAVIGRNNEAVEYALSMLVYSACVVIATNGQSPAWDEPHRTWVKEYEIPVFDQPVTEVQHHNGCMQSICFPGGLRVELDCVFTTRGDVFHNRLAHQLGARLDDDGQVMVNEKFRTTVPGLYAAGCVTPANCQMIIAAGDGAAAAQAINRDLFEESLRNHKLRRFREHQLSTEQTEPAVVGVRSRH